MTLELTQCRCDCCDWCGPMQDLRAQFDEMETPIERLKPGSVVPAGECPKCGAFAYIDDGEQQLRDAAQDLLYAAQCFREFADEVMRVGFAPVAVARLAHANEQAKLAIAKATGKEAP